MSVKGKMTFRFATAADAEDFARWAAENPQVDRQDIQAATKAENATVTYLVVEQEGVPAMFMPVYLTMRIGYLGFNPDNDRTTSLAAMETMLQAVIAFAQFYQIGQIETLTKSGLPVAEWARAHNFEADPRELYTLKIAPSANVCSNAPEEGKPN